MRVRNLLAVAAVFCAGARMLMAGDAGEKGFAVRYGTRFTGRKTASGEVYTGREFTAAHRSMSFGTRVRVTRCDDGRSVVVRINDRLPRTKGCVIDLSDAAAREIGLTGRTLVELEVLEDSAAGTATPDGGTGDPPVGCRDCRESLRDRGGGGE